MRAEDEEPCGSKSISTKSRRAPLNERSRRSKPRDLSIELNDAEKEELLRQYKETDQNLEKFAQAHNMTALNVKTVLRSVIKNHRALARVLGTEAPDDVVRITRSKTRAVQHSTNQGVDMTSNVPIKRGNIWVDLRFNEDDDFDDDYRPGEEDSRDDVGSDSDEESDHPSELEEDADDDEDDEQNETLVVKSPSETKRESRVTSIELPSRPRPDSAASLTLNAMMAEDDEPSNDYIWFLNTLNDPNDMPYNEQEDPEYMVPLDSLFTEDQDEDNANYWNSTIPQKEMEDLIEDIVPSEKLGELAKNLSPPLRHVDNAKQGTIVEVRPLSPVRMPVVKEVDHGMAEKMFNDNQRRQLKAQMEQHVQLLTQSYVGCYLEPLLQQEKEMAREMLESLSEIASCTGHLGKKSAFHIENLPFAIDTCNGMRDITPEKPIIPLTKEDLIITHRMLSTTREVLTSSPAILYPHLVSQHRLVQSIGRDGWEKNEIILFAMAYNRYAEAPVKHRLPRQSKYSIIAENNLPWRHMNELRWMYNGMKRGLERNGVTSHNRYFFDVIEGKKKVMFTTPLRAKIGWNMCRWPKSALPLWFSSTMKRKRIEEKLDGREKEISDEKRKRKERRIEEGDDENEPIVILDDGEEGEDIEIQMEEEELAEKKEGTNDRENVMTFSMEDDECAMDSMGKSGIGRSPEEVEEVRGEENGGGDGHPIDFSHLMNEMSPRAVPSRMRTPSPRRARSISPEEKSLFPPTPGKRIPSPLEESMPWLIDVSSFESGFDSPPLGHSPPSGSRIKTPGGTLDYDGADSLLGYFGTPEKEKERTRGPPSKNSHVYSNLFGDFDFDESDEDETTANVTLREDNDDLAERKDESEDRPESVTTIEERPNDCVATIAEVPVKQRKKRKTREEKEKMGIAAIKDVSIRRRVMSALARKASEDIRARMAMHSSIFKHIQGILSQTIHRDQRDTMLAKLEPVLSEQHREVLYLLSAFVPPSSLPRSLVLSQGRETYVAAINMMCTIYAYMSKMQRRLSYRQLLRMIVDAYSKGGAENVLETLKGVLVNDPLLLRVLSDYHTPSVPALKSRVWESIDLRKGEEAFNIFKENPQMERVDLCEVLGGVATKKMLVKAGKPLSTLMVNHDGEPMLRNKDGKYKEIAVMSEKQIEEERKNKVAEREEEKKAKQREKTRERKEAAKKAKMVERREERAREKKKAMERRQEEEERKKEEQQAPPSHPFTRDMDKALLMLYNDVQKVTKRAVRKMAADIPYSQNFTLEQLQSRLDFLLKLGDM